MKWRMSVSKVLGSKWPPELMRSTSSWTVTATPIGFCLYGNGALKRKQIPACNKWRCPKRGTPRFWGSTIFTKPPNLRNQSTSAMSLWLVLSVLLPVFSGFKVLSSPDWHPSFMWACMLLRARLELQPMSRNVQLVNWGSFCQGNGKCSILRNFPKPFALW